MQSIRLEPLADDVAPGSSVDVRVTLEARRGSDVYAVPHAHVDLRIVSAPGSGASVTPSSTDSGATGTVTVSVRTGDRPGKTVVAASSGSATGQATITAVVPTTPTAAASPTPGGLAASGGAAGGTGQGRGMLVAGLIAASVGGLAAVAASIRRPRGWRPRRVGPTPPPSVGETPPGA